MFFEIMLVAGGLYVLNRSKKTKIAQKQVKNTPPPPKQDNPPSPQPKGAIKGGEKFVEYGKDLRTGITSVSKSVISPSFQQPKTGFSLSNMPVRTSPQNTYNPSGQNSGGAFQANGRFILQNFNELYLVYKLFSGLLTQKLLGVNPQKQGAFSDFGVIVHNTNIEAFLSEYARRVVKLSGLSTDSWVAKGFGKHVFSWAHGDGRGATNKWTVQAYTREDIVQKIKQILPYDANSGYYDVRAMALECSFPDFVDTFFQAETSKNFNLLSSLGRIANNALATAGKIGTTAVTGGLGAQDLVGEGTKALEKAATDFFTELFTAIANEVDARGRQKRFESRLNKAFYDAQAFLGILKQTYNAIEIEGKTNTGDLSPLPWSAYFIPAQQPPANTIDGVYSGVLLYVYWMQDSRNFKNTVYDYDDISGQFWQTNPNYRG